MANTRIVLNRQSDLLMTGATLSTPHISNPTGLVQADILGLTSSLFSLETIDTSLNNRLSTEEITRSTNDSTEASLRVSGDASVTTRFSGEISSAKDSIDVRVSNEVSDRIAGDTSLTTRVSTEEVARENADSTEASLRTSADASLTSRLSTEESVGASADASLTTRISTEESKSSSADTSLTTRLSTEEAARTSADESLNVRVSAEESATLSIDERMYNFTTNTLLIITPTEAVNGSTTTFSLDISLISGNYNVIVTLNGLIQFEGEDFTPDKGTIGLYQAVFNDAPPAGSKVKFLLSTSVVL
jgi:hypothetical protein